MADFRKVKMMILQFGVDCEVAAPEELLRVVMDEVGWMGGVYEKDGR